MNDKNQILSMLRDEFNRWQDLVCGMTEAELITHRLPSDLSIKDVIAHLWAWQTRSVARLEAASEDREPVYPNWPADLNPETEGEPHELNAWIHNTYLNKPWWDTYRDWRNTYKHLLALAEEIPEEDLMAVGKYSWLPGYPLSAVLAGSYDHHHVEHWEPLSAWLSEHAKITPG